MKTNQIYMRLIAGAIALLGFVVPAFAGITSAGMNLGNTSAWTSKQTFYTATTSAASIGLPHGTAPSSPVNGDIWTTTSGLFAYINSATKQFATLSDAQTWSGQQTFGTSAIKHTHGIISDGTGNGSTTGNSRGTGAIDLQTNRSAATEVASGNYSTVIGYRNTASNTYAIAGGQNNVASGVAATSFGRNNTATATDAVAIGGSNTGISGVAIGQTVTNVPANGAVIGDNSNVASGTYAYGMGDSNTWNASGYLLGRTLSNSGADSIILGYGNSTGSDSAGSFTAGQSNLNYAAYASVLGNRAQSWKSSGTGHGWAGSLAVAGNNYGSGSGRAQTVIFNLQKQTTDATPTTLTDGTNTGGIALPDLASNYIMVYRAIATAGRATGNSAAYEVVGALKRVGSTTSEVGTATKTVLGEDNAAWDFDRTIDDTNEELDFTATGEAGVAINWHVTVIASVVAI